MGQSCTSPYFITSSPNGGVSDGGYYVHNNLWDVGAYAGTSGTTEVCSYRSWNHIAVANNVRGDGAVKTYPNVHRDYGDRPLSNYPVLASSFAMASPGVGIYDVAYDIWLNGVPGRNEIMVWTDNLRQVPAGSRVATGLAFSGHTWDLWATSGNGYLAFVPVGGARITSGTVNLREMLDYLLAQGRIPSNSTLGQICFGVEVVDTGGAPAEWHLTSFSITDR